MSGTENEITDWLEDLSHHSPEAAEAIWAQFYDKLVEYARRKLGTAPRRDADEEDIALSAFHSLHRGLQAGRFPKLDSRDDLWKILLTITSNKVKKRIRHQTAQKRGGGAVRGESIFAGVDEGGAGLGGIAGHAPTPEFAESVSLECEELLERLGDERLQSIALFRLQGYSNQEIADQLHCTVRSVERKLQLIRSIWQGNEA